MMTEPLRGYFNLQGSVFQQRVTLHYRRRVARCSFEQCQYQASTLLSLTFACHLSLINMFA